MGLIMRIIVKLLYGLFFMVCFTLLLILFTLHVQLPLAIAQIPLSGIVLNGMRLIIALWGMADTWQRGRGLPMRVFPPVQLVVTGICAWVAQPIYSGFVLLCLGVALFFGSATGTPLVALLVALGTTALVLGYERPYRLRTFGILPRPVFGLTRLLELLGRSLWPTGQWPREKQRFCHPEYEMARRPVAP
ncbi:MAG: hypothetical protein EI684_06910 [Candidatus Viridilinea halotolerans]|uniref:Uncharacterized protein n=1 Tax=Candidatus Viridilinea halotolerans TaxID=2491704 RepID=A0A426U3R4_9CHLR|nr:MAG: hypothetical protein EI684_06910 [Candidatus Viridilinea halotolerans]